MITFDENSPAKPAQQSLEAGSAPSAPRTLQLLDVDDMRDVTDEVRRRATASGSTDHHSHACGCGFPIDGLAAIHVNAVLWQELHTTNDRIYPHQRELLELEYVAAYATARKEALGR